MGGAAPWPHVPQKCLLFIQGESVLIAFPCPCPRRASSSPSSSSQKSSRVSDAVRNVVHAGKTEIGKTRKTINTFITGTLTLQDTQLGGMERLSFPSSATQMLLGSRWRIAQSSLCTVPFKSSIFITDEPDKKPVGSDCSSCFHHRGKSRISQFHIKGRSQLNECMVVH